MSHPGFVTEWNQPNPRIEVVILSLQTAGYVVKPLVHKTALTIEYSKETDGRWKTLLAILRTLIFRSSGGVLVFNRKFGNYGLVRYRTPFRWL